MAVREPTATTGLRIVAETVITATTALWPPGGPLPAPSAPLTRESGHSRLRRVTRRLAIPDAGEREKSTLALDADVADLVRRVHRAEQRNDPARTLSAIVTAMIETYVEQKHPDWVVDSEATT